MVDPGAFGMSITLVPTINNKVGELEYCEYVC